VLWLASASTGKEPPVSEEDCRVFFFQAGEMTAHPAGGAGQGDYFLLEKTPFDASLTIPIVWLRAVIFPSRTRGWSEKELLSKAGKGQELLLVPAKRGFDRIPGFIFRFSAEGVHFAPGEEQEARLFPWKKVAAVLRGPDPEEPPPPLGKEFDTRLDFPRGGHFLVKVLGVDSRGVHVRLPWGEEPHCPWENLRGLLPPEKDRLFLSMVRPLKVEEVPFLGPGKPFLFRWKADRSCTGGPLLAGGRRWPLGLGVHSRTRLTFALGGKWSRFFTLAAVDDSALSLPVRGDAALRIYADGKVLWERKSLQGGEGPVAVGPLDVSGAKELTLEVDFGRSLHLGDRVDWILPVLFR